MRCGTYRLESILSLTTTGALWRATSMDGHPCVIRFLATDRPPQQMEALRRRIDQLRAVTCEALLPIIDVIDEGTRLAVVSPYLTGSTMARLTATPGAIPPRVARTLVVDVARALAALHEVGLVHGDLTASNVVIHCGRAVVIDTLDEDVATPGWVPPESRRRVSPVRASAAGDVWAWSELARHLDIHHPITARAGHDDPAQRPSAREILETLTGAELVPVDDHSTDCRPVDCRPGADDHVGAGDVEPGNTELVSDGCLTGDHMSMLSAGDVAAAWRVEHRRHRTLSLAKPAHRRPRQRLSRRIVRAGVIRVSIAIVLIVVGSAVGISWFHTTHAASSHHQGTPSTVPCLSASQALDVVSDLTERRTEALATLNRDTVAEIYAPGAVELTRDLHLIDTLSDQGIAVKGMATKLSNPVVVSCEGDQLVVEVSTTQACYTRCRGEECVDVEGQPEQRLRMTLGGQPWRVRTVTVQQ